MQPIIWALGAMLLSMLIIAFLPIGITLRGKIFVVLSGFVLALGGLAAVSTFPLWQTALIIFLLIFVTTYIMDTRLATVIYNQQVDSFENENDESPVSLDFANHPEKTTDIDILDLGEIEVSAPSKNTNENLDEISLGIKPQMIKENNEQIEPTIDDDILAFQERTDTDIVEINEEPDEEAGYLADIESLIFEEPIELTISEEAALLEEKTEIKEVKLQKDNVVFDDENDLEELFFGLKESAASDEDANKESHIKKPVQLQK